MSKAFTKEDDGQDDLNDSADGIDAAAQLPTGFKNYITREGADRLRAELKRLLDVERPELVKTVSWAASNGDRSENADYIYGKRRLRQIDSRIRFLTKRIETAVVVDVSAQKQNSPNKVVFGATVTYRDEDDRSRKIRIVGIDEVNPSIGDISWISPLAKALLGATAGETVTLRSPKGEQDIEVERIEYN